MASLVDALGVSEMTVRRDLALLEQRGLLRRVRGGATPSQGRSYEPPFALRENLQRAAKERIAEAASELIADGDTVAVDTGSSALALARRLGRHQNLTVVTHSLPVAGVLAEHPSLRVIVTGGILRSGEQSLTGHLSERAFADFHVDKLFLGVAGVDIDHGLTEYNVEDTQVKRAMLRSAKDVTVLADSTKHGRVAFAHVTDLHAVQRIVTDGGAAPHFVAALDQAGPEVIVAADPEPADEKGFGTDA